MRGAEELMAEQEQGGSVLLHSWEEIARFLGVTTRTAQNWSKKLALPVFRVEGRVYAKRESLMRWIDAKQQEGSIYLNRGGA